MVALFSYSLCLYGATGESWSRAGGGGCKECIPLLRKASRNLARLKVIYKGLDKLQQICDFSCFPLPAHLLFYFPTFSLSHLPSTSLLRCSSLPLLLPSLPRFLHSHPQSPFSPRTPSAASPHTALPSQATRKYPLL